MVVGAGTMGRGIALCFADAGIPVTLIDTDSQALERAREATEKVYATQVERGRISAEEGARRLAHLTTLAEYGAALAKADVVIEAVFEDLALKQDVFARLGTRARRDALLATNTSTLDVDAIGGAAPHPERSLGLHFFSPAHVMRLLEVVRGARTSPATIEAALALGKRLGKVSVVVGNCDGFVGNRMLLAYRREAEFLLLEGATPALVDSALERFGFAMGPFAVSDLAGIDVGWRAKGERIKAGKMPPFAVTQLADALVAAGRFGQKTGKGWYRYEAGDRARHDDPDVATIIAAERARLGVAQHAVGDDEIVERCLYALVNEGARILDEGIASSAADIDTIWLNGYGFPKARGGPMRYADEVGSAAVLAVIERFAERDPSFWQPAPALVRLGTAGRRFHA